MTTLAEQVTAIKDTLDEIADDIYGKLSQIDDARIDTLAATNAANGLEANISKSVNATSISIDAVNGDDTNSGESNAPIKTWGELQRRFVSNKRVSVRLLSDVVMDEVVTIDVPPSKIFIRGYADDGVTSQRRKITSVNTIADPAYAGGLSIFGRVGIALYFVDIEMAHTANRNCFVGNGADVFFESYNCEITRTGAGDALFGGIYIGHFEINNTVIDASASGYVVDGVAAGEDPNAVPGVSANFTSA